MAELAYSVKKGQTSITPVPAQVPVLQRKCACEGEPEEDEKTQAVVQRSAVDRNPTAFGDGQRSGQPIGAHDFGRLPVRSPRTGIKPTKLAVSQPGDESEQEADRVAEHMTGLPAPAGSVTAAPVPALLRQRQDRDQEQEKSASPDMDAQIQSLSGTGQPLPGTSRAFFENRFGRNFDKVRVHADGGAAELADAVQARAFTVGRDIVFGAGEYAPETPAGRHLIAHELTHVVQQGAAEVADTPRQQAGRGEAGQGGKLAVVPGAYSLRLVFPNGERFIGPPEAAGAGPGGAEGAPAPEGQNAETQADTAETAQVGEKETRPSVQRKLKFGRRGLPQGKLLQRSATFTAPTPTPQDPLARLATGDSPGLTTPTINGNVVASHQDVLTQISPTQVVQTGTSGGRVTAQLDRGFTINTSANMIVASNAGARGWTGNLPTAILGNPASCAGHPQVPTTMNALPSNADFVTRVRNSEQEHANELQALHNRHFVSYDAFLMGLTGRGANLAAAGQDLVRQAGNRPLQAALAFTYGNQAQVQRLDGPGGTHSDDAVPTFAASCASVAITVSQSTPTIAGSGPGNVVTVAPTVTAITPAGLSVVGTDVMQGSAIFKHFTTAANARRALLVIQHYGMTSRNVIGAMEYFLAGAAAPHGALAGASELVIDPTQYQVTFGLPGASDWAITQVVGNNINVLVNFGNSRNEAYSALGVMTSLGFTNLCWVGGTRQTPEMLYFRT